MPSQLVSEVPLGVSKIGGYELSRRIGSGGVSEIYLGRQMSLDRPVAVKVLSPRLLDDADMRHRFDREALTIARLNHPNIIHVIDRGVEAGRYYFVMEYIDGDDLKALVRRRSLSVQDKCEIVVQCLKALDYAHKNGVIHRDMKPANILVDHHLNVHVADFGIAQLVGSEQSETTSASVVMGTPAYMSPEQRISTAKVDQTTDVYSMGVVFYELLTGEKPQGRFRPASTYSPEIPPALDDVLYKSLAQHPEDRFASAVEFKDAILAALSRAGRAAGEPVHTTIVGEAAEYLSQCTFLDTIKEHPYGATYLVEDRDTHELYVVKKIVKRQSGLKEASLLARLKHPHIVNIFGAGQDAEQAVVLMQYARGGSLSDRLVRRMPWRELVGILQACLDGLDFAHKNHVLHGNLRPSNILISRDHTPWLSDFGLPEHYAENQTNWYGAPEGTKSVAADVYSLGAIAYQLLTNQLPKYTRRGRLAFGAAADETPEGLLRILERMLERRAEKRYPSCGAVLEDLAALKQTAAVEVPAWVRAILQWRKTRLGWSDWLLGFCSGIVVALLITYLLGWLDLFLNLQP